MEIIILRDPNTVSGSSETMRTLLGHSFITSSTGVYDNSLNTLSENIQEVLSNPVRKEQFNTSSVFSNARIATRLVGERESFSSDEAWKKFLIGGFYETSSFSTIFNNNTYFNHNLKVDDLSIPLLKNDIKSSNTDPELEIVTEYYSFYPKYQSFVSTLDGITSLPIYYFLSSSDLATTSTEGFDVDRSYLAIETLYEDTYTSSEPTENISFQNFIEKNYTDSFNSKNDENKTRTIYSTVSDSDISKLHSLTPFGIKIKLEDTFLSRTPEDSSKTVYKDFIEDNHLESLFLRLLKESYAGEIETTPNDLNFITSTATKIYSNEASYGTENKSYRVVDLPSLLLNSINTPSASAANLSSFSSDTSETIAIDTQGFYKTFTTENTYSLFNFLNERANSKIESIENIDNILSKDSHAESLVFRIEKLGGAPTGDNRNNSVLQNFWFFNKREAFTYLDNQVKYNTDYTYKLYAYVLVEGLKYRNDDLVTTRLIATGSSNEENCLEFYSPFTDETQPQLFSEQNLNTIFVENQVHKDNVLTHTAMLNNEIAYKNDLINNMKQYLSSSIATLTAINTDRNIDGANVWAWTREEINKIFAYMLRIEDFSTPTPLSEQRLILQFMNMISSEFLNFANTGATPYSQEDLLFSIYSEGNAEAERLGTDLGLSETVIETTEAIVASFYTIHDNIDDEVFLGSTLDTAEDLKIEYFAFIDDLVSLIDIFKDLYDDHYQNYRDRDILQVSTHEEAIQGLTDLIEYETAQINIFENEVATNAQIFSQDRYLADFHTYVEPSFKIIEIPIAEKKVNIVDHPPVGILAEPTYFKDSSKRLCFLLRRNVFSYDSLPYPRAITEQDIANKNNYLDGKALTEADNIKERSVSPERFIKAYKLTTKPTTYEDFNGAEITTIDLKEPESQDIYGSTAFIDKVKTNTKYYYTFRMVNVNGISGPFTPIYESVLVDDGGYFYGDFNQLDESELTENRASKISIPFKKLLNIAPQHEHIQTNFADLDFNDTSLNQISEVVLGEDTNDPVWTSAGPAGRKFKFRLISKKTQKKVDINIVFDYTTK